MSEPDHRGPPVQTVAGSALVTPTWITVSDVVLRILHDAPALVEALADFWRAIGGDNSPPPHVAAAVKAAIDDVRAKQG